MSRTNVWLGRGGGGEKWWGQVFSLRVHQNSISQKWGEIRECVCWTKLPFPTHRQLYVFFFFQFFISSFFVRHHFFLFILFATFGFGFFFFFFGCSTHCFVFLFFLFYYLFLPLFFLICFGSFQHLVFYKLKFFFEVFIQIF